MRLLLPLTFSVLVSTAFSQALPPQPASAPKGEAKLSELSAMLKERNEILKTDPIGQQHFRFMEGQWKHLDELLRDEKIQTGADFYLASLVANNPRGFFEQARLHHELAIMSLILGEPNAPLLVGHTWERFLQSVGRGSRLGLKTDFDFDAGKPIPAKIEPSAFPGLSTIFTDPAHARDVAKASKDNPELKALRDADQAARGPNAPRQTTQDEILKFMREELGRRKRVQEIVRAGEAKTANDYESAALVMQHGTDFDSYATSHEFCLASLVLDQSVAAWLCAASYDRMLLSIGHRQRFGAQFSSAGLLPFDPGVDDTMRKLVKMQPLAEIQKRSESIRAKNP